MIPQILCAAPGDDSSYVWGAFWDGYNLSQRECFDNKCGAEAPVPRDASCFTGRLHCQHGGAECAVNAIQACSLNLAGFEWRRYLPFVVCMEDSYSNIQAAENYTVINETVKACAQTVTFTTDEVLQCFYTKKSYWLEEMAKRTIPHLTVPYVRVKNNTGEWFRLEIPEEGVVNNVLVQAHDLDSLLYHLCCTLRCPTHTQTVKMQNPLALGLNHKEKLSVAQHRSRV